MQTDMFDVMPSTTAPAREPTPAGSPADSNATAGGAVHRPDLSRIRLSSRERIWRSSAKVAMLRELAPQDDAARVRDSSTT